MVRVYLWLKFFLIYQSLLHILSCGSSLRLFYMYLKNLWVLQWGHSCYMIRSLFNNQLTNCTTFIISILLTTLHFCFLPDPGGVLPTSALVNRQGDSLASWGRTGDGTGLWPWSGGASGTLTWQVTYKWGTLFWSPGFQRNSSTPLKKKIKIKAKQRKRSLDRLKWVRRTAWLRWHYLSPKVLQLRAAYFLLRLNSRILPFTI